MKSLGVCYWYIKMTQFEVVEHGLEYIMFNDQKHMAPLLGSLFWFPAGLWPVTHICETPLLDT